MKEAIFIGIILFAGYILYAFTKDNDKDLTNPNGIKFFEGSWEEALDEAKKNDKLIFLDVYATWCGPCKKMKKTSFKDEEVGAFFNDHFINIAIDGETPEGQKILSKYPVRGYPSLLFVQSDESLKAIASGYQSSEKLMSYGKKFVPKK